MTENEVEVYEALREVFGSNVLQNIYTTKVLKSEYSKGSVESKIIKLFNKEISISSLLSRYCIGVEEMMSAKFY